jgi:hypothetical protein
MQIEYVRHDAIGDHIHATLLHPVTIIHDAIGDYIDVSLSRPATIICFYLVLMAFVYVMKNLHDFKQLVPARFIEDDGSLDAVFRRLPDTFHVSCETDDEKKPRCAVCLDAAPNGLFLPCGHLCACMPCALTLFNSTATCPICRARVIKTVQVFT